MVELSHLTRPGMARILVKVEGCNPTGSKKDRLAREVITAARRDGRLQPNQAVVEYSGGSTGTSLAFVCAALGHPLFIVSSDAFSAEKRAHMSAFGAQVLLVPSDGGTITERLIKSMIARAHEVAESERAFWTDQLNNSDATRGYQGLGKEIWEGSGRQVDAIVDCVGTAHGIMGVAKVLRAENTTLWVVAVEPAESPFLSTGQTGGHRIEGIGLGFRPPAWDDSLVDEVVAVSSEDAHAMARRLATEDGLFAGPSTGASVVAALRLAERLGEGKTVATIAVDSGMKYLSTEVFNQLH